MQIWPRNISNRKVKHESHGDVIGKTQPTLSHVEGRDDRGLDISAFAQDGCKVSCIRQNTKVALVSLAYADMASEHK